jgi:ribosomal protein S18 acetylase RimI-like enzyme
MKEIIKMSLSTPLLKSSAYHKDPSEIQSFNLALKNFKKIEQLESIQSSLKILENTFSQRVKLKHPRHIYPIYKALTVVTNEVAKRSLDNLSRAWEQVLKALNKRDIYRIGLGSTFFDTSFAQEILTKNLNELQKEIQISFVDVKNEQNRQEAINYIYKTDREAFGTCFQKGFLNEILKSDSVRCIAARNKKSEIVGILWGFLTQNDQLFHFWELSRNPSMACMNIAKKLIEFAKTQQSLFPNLKFATLNVDTNNDRAKYIYEIEDFDPLDKKEITNEKVFMTKKLTIKIEDQFDAEAAKTIVKKFVLNSVPLYKLIFYEIIRRLELIWRTCWYR